MPMFTTIKHFQLLAEQRKVTCALVTTVVGELIGTTVGKSQASHAEQHMVEEGFHLGGSHLGSHLYGDFRARESGHSMFFSVEESIEAITAALNTRAGADALAKLPGKKGGINLFSRTALGAGPRTYERSWSSKTSRAYRKFRADCVVVGLMDGKFVLGPILKGASPGSLVITTAYPAAEATHSSKVSSSKDWWEYNTSKSDLQLFDAEKPFAPWDLEEHTPMSLKDTWITT